MKIGIQTWGSEGDINPFIALASGLSKNGHEVTLAFTSTERKDYKTISKQHGFNLGTVDYIGKNEEHLNKIFERIMDSSNLLTQMKLVFEEMFEPGVPSMYKTAQSLCERNDIIIGHFIHHPIQAASEKAGKPYITVTINHGAIPTRYSPPIPYPNLGENINILLWKLAEKIINMALLPSINDLRRKEGLKLVKSLREVWESPICNLIAESPVLCQPREDWGKNQKICGFFRTDDLAVKMQMPDNLINFLNSGPPPVYMTLGSVISNEKNEMLLNKTTHLLYDAAKLAGCRAIIQSKWEFISGIPDDENIFRINYAPYTQVFPKCAAVVHHGGAGTSQIATLCGCPSIVIAHIPDQILWGTELKRIGIGAKVLNRRTVTPKKIAHELMSILNNSSIKELAKKINKNLEEEDGVAKAVQIIENQFKSN